MKTLTAPQRFALFNSWSGAIERCHNPDAHGFKDYGGRGISVCDRWRSSFDAFVADMGPRPDGMSIDRIDVNAGYSPDNCRWADRFTQARNKRNTKISEADLRDIISAAQEGHRPEAIAVFYGVTGSHIRNITKDIRPVPECRGTPSAKLTEAQVRTIRERHTAGEKPKDLAKAFGIQHTSVCNILRGRTWKHVA